MTSGKFPSKGKSWEQVMAGMQNAGKDGPTWYLINLVIIP